MKKKKYERLYLINFLQKVNHKMSSRTNSLAGAPDLKRNMISTYINIAANETDPKDVLEFTWDGHTKTQITIEIQQVRLNQTCGKV